MKIKSMPGSFFQRSNGRWRWQVTLPGENERKSIPLVPIGAKRATMDKNIAIEIAREIYKKATRKKAGDNEAITVAYVLNRYMATEATYYSPKEQTGLAAVARRAITLFGDTLAEDFSTSHFREFRDYMADEKILRSGHKKVQSLSRRTVNRHLTTIKRMFKWAAGEGLVPASVPYALSLVNGLRIIHVSELDNADVESVPKLSVERTIEYTVPIIADMIRLQQLIGTRPGELVIMRPCDVDTSKDVWVFEPYKHKNKHRGAGHERKVAIGPKGQKILKPYLARKEDDFCFKPKEAHIQRKKLESSARVTPLSCGNKPKDPDEWNMDFKEHYTTESYGRAIKYAIKKANKANGKKYIPHWSPNQLRHAVGQNVRNERGLEAASAVLGHADVATTKIYAKLRFELAEKTARELG